jgi:hypothetical protein
MAGGLRSGCRGLVRGCLYQWPLLLITAGHGAAKMAAKLPEPVVAARLLNKRMCVLDVPGTAQQTRFKEFGPLF